MTGNPGIPPGWVVPRCWTGWAIRDDAVKRTAAARINHDIWLNDKALARFIISQLSRLPSFAGQGSARRTVECNFATPEQRTINGTLFNIFFA